MSKSASLARSPAPQRKVLERTRALYAAGATLGPLAAERDVRDAMQSYFAAFAAQKSGADVDAAKARLHEVLAAAETEYAQALQRARRR